MKQRLYLMLLCAVYFDFKAAQIVPITVDWRSLNSAFHQSNYDTSIHAYFNSYLTLSASPCSATRIDQLGKQFTVKFSFQTFSNSAGFSFQFI